MKSEQTSFLLKKPILIPFFLASIILFTTFPAFSYSSSNGNINFDTEVLGRKESAKPQKASVVTNQITSDKNSSINFSISHDSVAFGDLVPGEPVERNSTLIVKNRSNYGYTVLFAENSALTSVKTKAIIPDTTCDEGICSDLLTSTWTSLLTYGLGVRCENLKGQVCTPYFDKNNYKQFPNLKAGEDYQAILRGSQDTDISAQIIYKLNIAPTQAKGSYQNATAYILLPNY